MGPVWKKTQRLPKPARRFRSFPLESRQRWLGTSWGFHWPCGRQPPGQTHTLPRGRSRASSPDYRESRPGREKLNDSISRPGAFARFRRNRASAGSELRRGFIARVDDRVRDKLTLFFGVAPALLPRIIANRAPVAKNSTTPSAGQALSLVSAGIAPALARNFVGV